MSFDWFFKRTFGGNQGNDAFQGDDEVKDFVDKNVDEHVNESCFEVPVMDPFENLEDTSDDMFQRMDEMLNRMFSSSLVSFGAENFSEDTTKKRNPRSLMLKDPDSFRPKTSPGYTPFEKEKPSRFSFIDTDIDDKVAKHGSLWKTSPENSTPHNFAFKKFSFQTVQLPDGSVEEHRSVTDSEGNTTTTVHRSIGEQSYEITTHSDANGLKEKKENFTNLDKSDLSDFEKRWQSINKSEQVPALDTYLKRPIEKLTPPTGDPTYLTLFKKFFGI